MDSCFYPAKQGHGQTALSPGLQVRQPRSRLACSDMGPKELEALDDEDAQENKQQNHKNKCGFLLQRHARI